MPKHTNETFVDQSSLRDFALKNMDLFLVSEDYKMTIATTPDLLDFGSHVQRGPGLTWSFEENRGAPAFFGYQINDAFIQGVLWERARRDREGK